MDNWIKQGHWWWLLAVPVATGIFALLGSWLGSKLGKSTEHWQWLRNEKQKEYVAAVESMSAIVDTLARLIQQRPTVAEVAKDTAFITPINVLGPNRVKKAMRTAMADIQGCLSAYEGSVSSGDMKQAQDAHDKLAASYDAFVASVRKDLGVKD